jgi:hypothetical protein
MKEGHLIFSAQYIRIRKFYRIITQYPYLKENYAMKVPTSDLDIEDYRTHQFGWAASINIEIYLRSDQKDYDKEYLIKTILQDYYDKMKLTK